MKKTSTPNEIWYSCTSEGHETAQIIDGMSLSLAEKLDWLENAEEISLHLISSGEKKI